MHKIHKVKNFFRQKERRRHSNVHKVVQIRRITKVAKGGRKLRFGVLVVVGNRRGQVGVGVGKANDIKEAIKKAKNNGQRNLIRVPLTKNFSIPHPILGQYGASNVIIKPARAGTGVIAGSSVRILLETAGIRNILAKQLGSNNLLNNARASIYALKSIKRRRKRINSKSVDKKRRLRKK